MISHARWNRRGDPVSSRSPERRRATTKWPDGDLTNRPAKNRKNKNSEVSSAVFQSHEKTKRLSPGRAGNLASSGGSILTSARPAIAAAIVLSNAGNGGWHEVRGEGKVTERTRNLADRSLTGPRVYKFQAAEHGKASCEAISRPCEKVIGERSKH